MFLGSLQGFILLMPPPSLHPHASVERFGEYEVWSHLSNMLEAHNELQRQYMAEFGESSSSPVSYYEGEGYGIKLGRLDIRLRWSRHTFQTLPVNALLSQFGQALDYDRRGIDQLLSHAFFDPFNREIFDEETGQTLQTRPLLNGDGEMESHTHYSGTKDLTPKVVSDVLDNVLEHGLLRSSSEIWISSAQSPLFHSWQSQGVFQPIHLGLHHEKTDIIGYFSNVVVKVKSWIPPYYLLAVGREKHQPLIQWRLSSRTREAGLFLCSKEQLYPLRCEYAARYLGAGIKFRHAAAAHFIGEEIYVVPDCQY